MSQNHLELVGVETRLKALLYKLGDAFRDGTLLKVGEVLKEIELEAEDDGFRVNKVMFGR